MTSLPAPVFTVRGNFAGAHRRPYVLADVAFPRLGVSAEIRFLVDTGADRTAVHWGDRLLLRTVDGAGLPADAAFPEIAELSGIEGIRMRYGREGATLVFRTEQGVRRAVDIDVDIALHPVAGVPSLLGRDFLGGVRLDFNMPGDDLVIEWR